MWNLCIVTNIAHLILGVIDCMSAIRCLVASANSVTWFLSWGCTKVNAWGISSSIALETAATLSSSWLSSGWIRCRTPYNFWPDWIREASWGLRMLVQFSMFSFTYIFLFCAWMYHIVCPTWSRMWDGRRARSWGLAAPEKPGKAIKGRMLAPIRASWAVTCGLMDRMRLRTSFSVSPSPGMLGRTETFQMFPLFSEQISTSSLSYGSPLQKCF